jgi:hypothetical protein
VQVILQRSSGDQKTVPRVEKTDDLGERGLLVLNTVGLNLS